MRCFTLIKRGELHVDGRKVIPREEFADLLSAHELMEMTLKEREEILEEAREEAKEIKKQAEEAGFQEGLDQFNEHILYLNGKVQELRTELQKQILPLSIKSIRRIVGKMMELDPDLIVSVILEAIKSVSSSHFVKIYLSKADLESAERQREEIKKQFEHLELFKLEEKKDLEKGSCLIETEKGILNASLENQFRSLEKAFSAHMAGG